MRIFMCGWELPPHNSGGLGVACLGFASALTSQGIAVTFVLPKKNNASYPFFNVLYADDNPWAYQTSLAYSRPSFYEGVGSSLFPRFYGAHLFDEVEHYANAMRAIASNESFDVIHAHDWLSFGAGIAAKEVSGKPLVAHVHATEFDRTGGIGVNGYVYAKEREGMEKADKIIAVSHYTKDMIMRHYKVDPQKIAVVHNAIEVEEYQDDARTKPFSLDHIKKQGSKLVVFIGRITLQKGPDYFLQVAKRVCEYDPHVLFVIAGSGDMETQIVEEAGRLGISDKFLFAGFLRGDELRSLYQAADLFVMPSVSEPFGITALESLASGTPVLISRQSGVSEVLSHALKVDFWDIDEMTNKILAVLRHPSLRTTLKENGNAEVRHMSWREAARKCMQVYTALLKPV